MLLLSLLLRPRWRARADEEYGRARLFGDCARHRRPTAGRADDRGGLRAAARRVRGHTHGRQHEILSVRMPPHLAYTFFMLLALAAFVIARRAQPDPQVAPLGRRDRFFLAWAAFVGAGLGAKLPFVIAAGRDQWLA